MTDQDGWAAPPLVGVETFKAYMSYAPNADGWHLLDNMTPDELRDCARAAILHGLRLQDALVTAKHTIMICGDRTVQRVCREALPDVFPPRGKNARRKWEEEHAADQPR